jgi:hypothetical protein
MARVLVLAAVSGALGILVALAVLAVLAVLAMLAVLAAFAGLVPRAELAGVVAGLRGLARIALAGFGTGSALGPAPRRIRGPARVLGPGRPGLPVPGLVMYRLVLGWQRPEVLIRTPGVTTPGVASAGTRGDPGIPERSRVLEAAWIPQPERIPGPA